MILVTIFICIPFTIREVEPVLQELGKDEEDASRTLGASIGQTFRKVTLPNIRWALLYGMALSTARAIGEIGAVLLVSGNLQGKTWTATLFIYNAFEQRHESQAYVVALILAAVSIVLLARHRSRQAPHRHPEGEDHMTQPIVVEGLTKRFGVRGRVRRRRSPRRPAPSPRCWAPGLGQEHGPADHRRPRDARRRAGSSIGGEELTDKSVQQRRAWGSCSSTTRCSVT